MSVQDAAPEEFEGIVQTAPCYFRIFFAAVSPDGELEYKDQSSENGPFNSTFTRLTDATYTPARLNTSLTQDGYVALLAQDAPSKDLVYIVENRDMKVPGRFAEPQNLGKPDGVSDFLDTAMTRGLTGRQNVFATSADAGSAVWWKFQNSNTVTKETITTVPPGTETPVEVTVPVEVPPEQLWSDWQQIEGDLCSLAVTQNADGRIILTGINAASVPYFNIQSSDRPLLPEGWEGWQDISGGLTGFEQLACGIDGDALVHIFARIGSKIYMKAQQQVSSTDFSDWALFASFDSPVATIALAPSCNNGLYLAAQVGSGGNSPVYASYQTGGADKNWSAPKIIAHVANSSALVLQPNADTWLSLFALDTSSSSASYLNQISLDHWAAVWTDLGGPVASISVTQDVTPNPS